MLLSTCFKYHVGQDCSGNFKYITCFKVEEKQKAKEKRKDIPNLNVVFQRIAKRDKKAFLSEQCKEIDENNRMGKTIEITSRKLETQREHFMQRWVQLRAEMV